MFNLAVPRATPSFPSCSPNFPRASTTRYTYAKQGSILYFLIALNCSLFGERQLISEVDIFDLVWRLWGYFLPCYSHIYFFFWPPTCLIWPRSLKLNYEFPNSSSPILASSFCLFYFHICSFTVEPTIILLCMEVKLGIFLFNYLNEKRTPGSISVVKYIQNSCRSITLLRNCQVSSNW